MHLLPPFRRSPGTSPHSSRSAQWRWLITFTAIIMALAAFAPTMRAQENAVLTKEQNDMLTRVGPGTPMGELLRRYWQPIAPAQELSDENPTKFVRLLGEDLVLFRDKSGRVGAIQDILTTEVQEIHKVFETAIDKYAQLDNVVPEPGAADGSKAA